MFIHILGYVRHVKVGVVFVSELLELGVERFLEWSVDVKRRQNEEETHPGEADFVAKIVEATDAVLGILKVVILDESEANWLAGADERRTVSTHPLQRLDLRSMMDLELWMSPKRLPQVCSISSVVSGNRPRM
jgi:hypothetical protein